ncbi:MAG: hypothetical protein HY785_00030 [Oscillatoriophycideae cyanobacterium NC_groundwater_1537_Pr4_S-0.65um_50_18]|nr:hypothetical protein [Oscillatoriophycideae cyanobacterium NC_groundwater_1537_Pr4_S-0.65um_50_18]
MSLELKFADRPAQNDERVGIGSGTPTHSRTMRSDSGQSAGMGWHFMECSSLNKDVPDWKGVRRSLEAKDTEALRMPPAVAASRQAGSKRLQK